LKAGSTISAEGRIDDGLNMSRAIGDLRYKKNKGLSPLEHPVIAFPEVKKIAFNQGIDFVVLGCDGIWEMKTN
jgi:serine/threonine protein phosphatase PrpC